MAHPRRRCRGQGRRRPEAKTKGGVGVLRQVAACLVGMEACGSAHYWAREIIKLGHTVKLMPLKYVKARDAQY